MSGFLDSINASKIVVSLPLQSLGTHSPLSPKYENVLRKYADERGITLDSFEYGNEVFYVIENTNGIAAPCI